MKRKRENIYYPFKSDANTELETLKECLLDPEFSPANHENHAIKKAAEKGYTDIIKILLADPRADPATNNNFAIQVAASNGHIEIVTLLLADPRVNPAVDNNFAILCAAQNGHTHIVTTLLTDSRVLGLHFRIEFKRSDFTAEAAKTFAEALALKKWPFILIKTDNYILANDLNYRLIEKNNIRHQAIAFTTLLQGMYQIGSSIYGLPKDCIKHICFLSGITSLSFAKKLDRIFLVAQEKYLKPKNANTQHNTRLSPSRTLTFFENNSTDDALISTDQEQTFHPVRNYLSKYQK